MPEVPVGPQAPVSVEGGERAYWRRVLSTVLGRDFQPGNAVDVLQNGDAIFRALLDAVASARRTIELETYVYEDGDVGRTFTDALVAAARRGVAVRVLVDAVGSVKGDASLRALREGGVRVRVFRPVSRMQVLRSATFDNRTHRKILVVDDEVSFLGGVGIADEWAGDARSPEEWRETHFVLRGPAVAPLFAAFLGHWVECGPLDVDMLRGIDRPPEGTSEVLVLASVGLDARSAPSLLYHALLEHAQRRVRITTPYFVPDSATSGALMRCVSRGVEVELLLPGPHTDHRVCDIAGTPTLRTLHEHGVPIWRYQPTFIHTKTVTVDGLVSVVGSANFNHRSLLKDDEALAIALDTSLAHGLDRAFDADAARSRRMGDEDLLDPGPLRRIAEWAARRIRRQL